MAQPTVVISRSSDGTAARRAFEDALAEGLASRGVACVFVIPPVYWLTPSHPAVPALKQMKGDVFFASWLYPRAARAVLQAHGVTGSFVETPFDARSVRNSRRASSPARKTGGTIHLWHLPAFDTPESCADGLVEAAGLASAGSVPVRRQPDLSLQELKSRWYPVIDYDLCAGCKQCYDFCLFGVYSVEKGGRVVVTKPDKCKPGCPACARNCPRGAIIFPHYDKDAAIAGGPRPAGTPETPSSRKQVASGRSRPAKRGRDDLDDLIDTLDTLDV